MEKRITSQMMYIKTKAPYFHEEDLEIILVLKGQIKVTKMERVTCLNAGDFTFTNRHIVHYIESEQGAHVLVTRVHLADFNHIFNRMEYVEFLNNNEIIEVDRPLKKHLNRIVVDKLIKLYQSIDDSERAFEEVQLVNMLFFNYQLITHIKKEEEYPTSELLDRYYKVVQYIMENIDKKIMTEDIIKLVYMNPTYFSQFMKKVGGVGFKEFVFYRKLIMICKSLSNPKMTMNKTALSVGITDMKSFYHNFKKTFGVSPAKWRHHLLSFKDDYQIIDNQLVLNEFIEINHIHRHRDNTITRVLKFLIANQDANDLTDAEIEFDLYQDMGETFDPDYQVYKHMSSLTQKIIELNLSLRISLPIKYILNENSWNLFISAIKEHTLLFGTQATKREQFVLCVSNPEELDYARQLVKFMKQDIGNISVIISYQP